VQCHYLCTSPCEALLVLSRPCYSFCRMGRVWNISVSNICSHARMCVSVYKTDCSTRAIRSLAPNVERRSNAGENWICTRSLTKVSAQRSVWHYIVHLHILMVSRSNLKRIQTAHSSHLGCSVSLRDSSPLFSWYCQTQHVTSFHCLTISIRPKWQIYQEMKCKPFCLLVMET